MDPNNCFLDIQAGSGGTEAQDWAAMLERMYLRYCERRGFQVEVLEESPGEVAGIKSAALKVTGEYAYGNLRTESGVHRLVRKSPFDSQCPAPYFVCQRIRLPRSRRNDRDRHQSGGFARRHVPRRGAGGQHINKTDSAIRITHLPPNIVVQCQSDRSQHRNRAEAMAMLKAAPVRDWKCASATKKSRPWKIPRPTSAGATKSAPTCSISRASRICAPTWKEADTQAVLDGDLEISSPPV